jgi:hypothetical protein
MPEKRPDQMDVLISAMTEFGRRPDPEVLRLMAEHPKRPRDLNQWAKHMVDIATGSEAAPTRPKKRRQPRAIASRAAKKAK